MPFGGSLRSERLGVSLSPITESSGVFEVMRPIDYDAILHKEEHCSCSRSWGNTEETEGQRRNTAISSVHTSLVYLLNAAYKPWVNWHLRTTSWKAAVYWHKSNPAQRAGWLLGTFNAHVIFLQSSPLNQMRTVVSTAVTFLAGTCFGTGSFMETMMQPSGPRVTMAALQPLSSSTSPTRPASSGFPTAIPVRISAWRKSLNTQFKQTNKP